ncbi:dnaJ-like protein subfamily A member 1 [Caerostris extrusa]|uniref:DnaJ-like protein subfamily A member 1 n=1 Tax=Caerostris extrusa TaxID=172846 RepID=A0AAV4XFK1_CAEEX|nr:dnaJ-like protein subfamily A member 1 [Caerostris extrusa]
MAMEVGHKITFTSEGDQKPGLEPGNVISVIDEKKLDFCKKSRVISFEGIPRCKNDFEKNNLIIQFNVRTPEQFSVTAKEQTEAILPPRLQYIVQDNADQAFLSSALKSSKNQRYKQAYEEDGERYEGSRGAQC